MVECCVDVSRATAYGLCMSQIFFTVACILYSPKKEIILYTLKSPSNTSDVSVHEMPIHVQGLFGIMSLLAFFFSMQTMNSDEQSYAHVDFNKDFINQNILWDILFWVYSIGSHVLLVGIILSICDVYLLLCSIFIIQYSLYNICQPKEETQNMTKDNTFLLAYVIAIWLILYNADRQELILCMIVMDYCLGMGHTWDRQVAVNTVINCRLTYICCQSLVLCVYYLI
jgi:hypothetical protein